MNTQLQRLIFLALFCLIGVAPLTAQTPVPCPSNDTPAANNCEDACIYADLSGYTGKVSGFSGSGQVTCDIVLDNDQWLAFIADATTATITATPSNCTAGNGIQVAIYSDCISEPISCGCNRGGIGYGNTPVSVSVNLTPGEVYYLMVDGFAGDQCDFTINMAMPGGPVGILDTQEIELCPG
jgi:hypothetical protein